MNPPQDKPPQQAQQQPQPPQYQGLQLNGVVPGTTANVVQMTEQVSLVSLSIPLLWKIG